MKIIRELKNVKEFTELSTIVIGNFDGVHLGHQEIIKKCSQISSSGRFGILTFDPHPRDYFQKELTNFKLTTKEHKYSMLKKLNISFLVELKFDKNIEILTPENFVKSILYEKLGAKQIIVGNDFRFGYKRSGDIELLKHIGQKYKINVFSLSLTTFGKDKISKNTLCRRWHKY